MSYAKLKLSSEIVALLISTRTHFFIKQIEHLPQMFSGQILIRPSLVFALTLQSCYFVANQSRRPEESDRHRN